MASAGSIGHLVLFQRWIWFVTLWFMRTESQTAEGLPGFSTGKRTASTSTKVTDKERHTQNGEGNECTATLHTHTSPRRSAIKHMKAFSTMRSFRAMLAFFVIGLLHYDAHACSCLPPPPVEDALDRSDVVIYGQCYKFTFHPKSHRTELIKVLRTFKREYEEGKLFEIDTAVDSGMCGYSFVAGHHYIIYATERNGRYSTKICTKTTTAPPHYHAARMALKSAS